MFFKNKQSHSLLKNVFSSVFYPIVFFNEQTWSHNHFLIYEKIYYSFPKSQLFHYFNIYSILKKRINGGSEIQITRCKNIIKITMAIKQ